MRMHSTTGRALWTLLHAFAKSYPVQPSEEAINGAKFFFEVFEKLVKESSMGCGHCSEKWSGVLSKHPPDFSSRDALYLWTVAAHDKVNQTLGKPIAFPAFSLAHPIFRG